MLKFLQFPFILFAGILITLLSFIGIGFACVFLIVFYCFYRFIWLFSDSATIERRKRRFEQRKQRLLYRAQKKRSDYSMNADRQDIVELIQQIDQHLQPDQQLDPYLIKELHYLLDRYQLNLNFEKALRIHTIVTNTDKSILNATISKILNDITILD